MKTGKREDTGFFCLAQTGSCKDKRIVRVSSFYQAQKENLCL